MAFPGVTYHSHSAKSRILRLPLAALRLGNPNCGNSEVYLIEHSPGNDYHHLLNLMTGLLSTTKAGPSLGISKEELKHLLRLAGSDKERECIRYTAWRASGLSQTAARKHLGLENMNNRADKIQAALEEAQAIRESVERMACIQEKAALEAFGLMDSDSSSNTESEIDSEFEDETSTRSTTLKEATLQELVTLLRASSFNWFEMDFLLQEHRIDQAKVETKVDRLLQELTPEESKLAVHSREAFLHFKERVMPEEEREASAFNGDIVSESEQDDPDEYLTQDRKAALVKKIKYIRQKARRDKAKAIAQRRFLTRKRSKKVSNILTKFPDIGKEIERYVEERSVGADAWRRTGVLTFDGNKKVAEKVTYQRIKDHLESVYSHKFAYGTVVQLCIARNRRRCSSKRYKGVARVTTRRARKGFMLKYNPDTHWSSALYKGLNLLQFTDGSDKVIVNRDDAAGYRLDTLSTHRLHRNPVVQGHEILTTRTDFVNNYPSILKTTSYNFTGTKNTPEMCAGVVKGAGVFPKNPAQHLADYEMLETSDVLKPAFINPLTDKPKILECVRVDGATDEGPSHLEIQFWWTLRHLERPTFITLVSTRSSGASYLNRVELQNGCLALAHANLFIPSNLNGSCFDPETGKLDQERLKANMDLATEIYISRCDNAPCGETTIHLFKGADSTAEQELCSSVVTFLKGSKSQRQLLKQNNPGVYERIEKVWQIREKHMVQGLPAQYLFYLKCCLDVDCTHPFCNQQVSVSTWFPGGPQLSYLPFPVPDPSQPWGNSNCSRCEGQCSGHFLPPDKAIVAQLSPMKMPPSQVLKEIFDGLSDDISEECVLAAAKKCLLPPAEVKIWFDHLLQIQKNRKRGAEKAAATRRQKKEQVRADKARAADRDNPEPEHQVRQTSEPDSNLTFCGVCCEVYAEVTDEPEDWIQCDICLKWFHFVCASVDPKSVPEHFVCVSC